MDVRKTCTALLCANLRTRGQPNFGLQAPSEALDTKRHSCRQSERSVAPGLEKTEIAWFARKTILLGYDHGRLLHRPAREVSIYVQHLRGDDVMSTMVGD